MNTRTAIGFGELSRNKISGLLDTMVARQPEALAAVDGDLRLTYGELASRVQAFSKGLLAQGVRRGDRVAMLTPPSVHFWIAFHATTAIGAIWVGINPVYQKRDFEHLLGDCDPTVLFAISPFDGRDYCAELAAIKGASVPMFCIGTPTAGARPEQEFLDQGRSISETTLGAAMAAVMPEDPALIVYTSGTTGKPKGAMLSHRAIALSAEANAAWMGREALAKAICAAPVNHVGAINNISTNVLAAGGALVFHPRVDMQALGALSAREQPSYLVSSPTGFAMMLAHQDGTHQRLMSAKLIVFGGAATALSVLEQIAPSGARLSSVYGQTETCGIITHTDDRDDLAAHADTIGRPLAGAVIRIADAQDQECPQGEVGEIQVLAPYVMSGYFRNPEATKAAFTADGYLRTGDIGLRRSDGNLVFVGRLKEMFKSGGYNVYPVEIEQAICEHPAIALAAVVSIPHPTYQEVGRAFVQPRPGSAINADELRAFLKERIANYKVPKEFVIEAELPRLPNSKIDKMALKQRA